ncbi:glycosyltransferase family 39 protein [Arthrobacter psychrolactophilus]
MLINNIDAVHGIYYLFMHFWLDWFGQTPFVLRLPSAIAIGIAGAGTYLLGVRLWDKRFGLTSAVVFAIMPRLTWSGMEARSYAFSAAIAVWLAVALFDALKNQRSQYWVLYGLLSGLAISINLYSVLLLACHGVILLVSPGTTLRSRARWLLVSGAGAVLSIPVLYLSISQRSQISDEELSPLRWVRNVIVNQWFLGRTPTGGVGSYQLDIPWMQASVLMAVVAWAVMSFALVRIVQLSYGSVRWLLLAWLIFPVGLPTLVIGIYSLFVHPMYNPRYLAFSAPSVALLIGLGLCLIRWRWLAAATLISLTVFSAPIYVSQRQVYAKSGTDWASVAAYVQGEGASGDGIYFTSRYPTFNGPVGMTQRRIAFVYPAAFVGLNDITAEISPARSNTLDGFSRTLAEATPELDSLSRLWVIRRLDYPTYWAEMDNHVLNQAGFIGKRVWWGPMSEIMVYSRP